jgi:hypothetical protein
MVALRRSGIPALRFLLCAGVLAGAAAHAAAPDTVPDLFHDAQDGWFDVGGFLDTVYGFVPVIAPITEPAVGYGAAGALVFIDRHPAAAGQPFVRPNIAAIGGLATENGTRGAFAGHLGTWMGGRLRTVAALADADVNLEYFGLGGERPDGSTGFDYSIAARGGAAGGSFRLGEFPVWLGVRYARVNTDVALEDGEFGADVSPRDLDLELAALTPSLTLDMRDNFFTPTQGWYADLSAPFFREGLGSERDFEKSALQVMYYRPLGDTLFLGLRGGVKASSDGTPFYLRPYVWLRGVQALGYQGEQAAEAEAELRWQLHPRFSLVGFGGAGIARSDIAGRNLEESVTAGGAGFRYLVARRHGLHMGLDLAFGPDDPVIYVVFGSAWMRP